MVHLTLEDGRSWWRATVVASAAYALIAAAIESSHPKFKRWLRDMSNRPVPFMDFDLRNLKPEHRNAFHTAVRHARDALATKSEIPHNDPSHVLAALNDLIQMKENMD